MSEGPHPIATSSQTVGPFFHFSLTANERLGVVASPDTPGEHLRLRVRVLDGAGEPVPDGIIEIYQADAEGRYPDSTSSGESAASVFSGFGRLPTGADGWCQFKTIRPGPVVMNGIGQAPHVNVCLLARGLLRQIYTRIYFKDDPALATDPILQLVPEGRRRTLIANPSAGEPDAWDFVIRMQGDDETVFFDL
jgi:protocatechuate 3,4-dioxygenase alpha subunit